MSTSKWFSQYLTIIITVLVLCGCVIKQHSNFPTAESTRSGKPNESTALSQTESPTPTRTLQPALQSLQTTPAYTASSTPRPSPTRTPSPTATALLPEEQERLVALLLRTNGGCLSPCFWGIIPNQTTVEEARFLFQKLEVEMDLSIKTSYDLVLSSISGLQGGVTFSVQNGVITGVRAIMTIFDRITSRRDWAAFTPEDILKTYGIPSDIRFWLIYNHDLPAPGQEIRYWIDMYLYYDNLNLIIEYHEDPIERIGDSYHYCPTQNNPLGVSITMWMGKDAFYPPSHDGALMEDATTLSYQEFYQLIIDNPGTACLDLKADAFKDQ